MGELKEMVEVNVKANEIVNHANEASQHAYNFLQNNGQKEDGDKLVKAIDSSEATLNSLMGIVREEKAEQPLTSIRNILSTDREKAEKLFSLFEEDKLSDGNLKIL